MVSSGGLLAECVQQLKASPHDYEKLLGSCVDTVWRTISVSVERQLRLHKGVGLPMLGKFAFVRDHQPLTPVFLLADRFASTHGVVWRRPPPALLTPVTEVNLSVVGNDAGGLPKDQVTKALEAFLTFVGFKLQKGTASGGVRLGNVGAFAFDGKAIAFHFEAAFVHSIVTTIIPQSDAIKNRQSMEQASSLSTRKATSTIPRAVSLHVLPSVEPQTLPTTVEERAVVFESHDLNNPNPRHRHQHRRDHHTSKQRRRSGEGGDASSQRHTKSIGQLLPAPVPADARVDISRQILPRFMVVDASHSPSKLLYDKQSAALQHTFEFQRHALQQQQALIAKHDEEIERRTEATRLRCVQERAEKTVSQREVNAYLHQQIEIKHSEKQRQMALNAASINVDEARILPQESVMAREQRQILKTKLRGRLNDQVAVKASLARQRLAVDHAESAYFMTKVLEQGQLERDQRNEMRKLTRETLTAGWQQQLAMKDECERLRARP